MRWVYYPGGAGTWWCLFIYFLLLICIGLLYHTEVSGGKSKLQWILRFPDNGNSSFKAHFSIPLTTVQNTFNIELLFLLIWRLYGIVLAPK